MSARSSYFRLVLALVVALAMPRLWAQDGAKGAAEQANFGSRLGSSFAIADLDGDHQPDGAVLLKPGWPGSSGMVKIQLHLTSHTNSEIAFQSSESMLAVTAWDIDNDGDIDLVVEEAVTHKPLRVWINDGNGVFHEGRIQDFPSLTPGTQDQLSSPYQVYHLALCLPPQRGFEVPTLAAGALARPPSKSNWKARSIAFSVKSHAYALNSCRAPPLC